MKVNRVSYSMLKDVCEMENISKQTVFLAENNIKTKKDLIDLYDNYKKDLFKKENPEIKEKIQLVNEILKRTELTDEESERENEKEAQTIDNTNDISAVMQQTNKIKMIRLNIVKNVVLQ